MRHANPNLRQASQLVYDYESASKFLGGREERKLAHNTLVLRDWRTRDAGGMHGGDGIAVRYHATNIVTYYPDGTIVVNNGGYMTVTTNKRLNLFLPPGFRVMQKNWQMYLLAPHDRKLPFSTYVEFNADNLRQAGEVVQLEHNRELVPKHIGEGRDLWTPRKQNPSRHGGYASNPKRHGKFYDDLDAAVWQLTMDGPDAEFGDVDEYGMYVCILRNIGPRDLERAVSDSNGEYTLRDLSDDLGLSGLVTPFSAVASTDSDGFVTVDKFQTVREADRAFNDEENRYIEWIEEHGEGV